MTNGVFRISLAQPQQSRFTIPDCNGLFSAALGECGWSSDSTSIRSLQLETTLAYPAIAIVLKSAQTTYHGYYRRFHT